VLTRHDIVGFRVLCGRENGFSRLLLC
jgi:hypothetical protein